MIARFRCGNEEWGETRWTKDPGCQVCGGADETLIHIRESCCPDPRSVMQLLNERGTGEQWMRGVIDKRNLRY